jgi:hypothetical protein
MQSGDGSLIGCDIRVHSSSSSAPTLNKSLADVKAAANQNRGSFTQSAIVRPVAA